MLWMRIRFLVIEISGSDLELIPDPIIENKQRSWSDRKGGIIVFSYLKNVPLNTFLF